MRLDCVFVFLLLPELLLYCFATQRLNSPAAGGGPVE